VFRNPAFIARRRLSRAIAEMSEAVHMPPGQGVLLDVGCGSKPYRAMFDVRQYIGVDVRSGGHPDDDKSCDVFFDGRTLPVADGSADVVLCTQVLEHAQDANALLAEIARVLKPDGRLLLTVPFVWEEHEKPFDFRRFTAEGITRDLRSVGLEPTLCRKTAGSFETAAQVTAVSLHRGLGGDVPVWGSVVTAVVCAPVQICGMMAQAIIPDGWELYLDLAVIAVKSGILEGTQTA
jgi:SAM-dependent methyltransferase